MCKSSKNTFKFDEVIHGRLYVDLFFWTRCVLSCNRLPGNGTPVVELCHSELECSLKLDIFPPEIILLLLEAQGIIPAHRHNLHGGSGQWTVHC